MVVGYKWRTDKKDAVCFPLCHQPKGTCEISHTGYIKCRWYTKQIIESCRMNLASGVQGQSNLHMCLKIAICFFSKQNEYAVFSERNMSTDERPPSFLFSVFDNRTRRYSFLFVGTITTTTIVCLRKECGWGDISSSFGDISTSFSPKNNTVTTHCS